MNVNSISQSTIAKEVASAMRCKATARRVSVLRALLLQNSDSAYWTSLSSSSKREVKVVSVRGMREWSMPNDTVMLAFF